MRVHFDQQPELARHGLTISFGIAEFDPVQMFETEDLVQAADRALRSGSLVLAHNSVNAAAKLVDYLAYVRDPNRFQASANMCVDGEGLEVSVYR